MPGCSKILVRATNWVGDAVMTLPALHAIRESCPGAEIVVLARPWVADIYARQTSVDRVVPYPAAPGFRDLRAKWRLIRRLRKERFDCAILFQNAFEAAVVARLAGVPRRIGYDRDGRGWLLTDPIAVPKPTEIPRHERFYYLELLRRSGLGVALHSSEAIRLDGAQQAAEAGARRLREMGIYTPVIGISPGSAYGSAKRWNAESFAAAAGAIAIREGAGVLLFGSASERGLCDSIGQSIRSKGGIAHNLAGETSLAEFIDLTAVCRLFLTNDSGAMHIASALGVRTVAIFGPTNDVTTGPTGPLSLVVRQPVDCSPCFLRECPIDHRCMTGVSAARVARAAGELLVKT